jgi:hypothetical protein
MTAPAKELAKLLARYGRHGDTELVHMSKGEVHALKLMSGLASGGQSINPDTGLPEAFDLSWLIPIAAIAAIALTGGAAAPAVLGAEAAGAAAVPALAGGATTAATLGTTAAADAAAIAATEAAAGLGGSAAYNATLGGIANAGQGALASSAGLAGTPMAGASLAQGVEAANALNATNPYIANVAGMPPTPPEPSLLSKVGNFATDNPLLTLGGLSMLTPPTEAPKQEEESPEPENEWRPGQGYVPFEQKGVRYGIQQPISPTGQESMQIGYGPSVAPGTIRNQFAAMEPGFKTGPFDELKTQRRFAKGGRVPPEQNQVGIAQVPGPAQTYGDQLSALKAQYARPFTPSQDIAAGDGSGMERLFGGRAPISRQPGGKRGNQNPVQNPRPSPGSPPPMGPPNDPSWYLSGLPAVNNPTPTATRAYNPVVPTGADIPQPPDLRRPQGYAMGGEVEQKPKYKTDLSMLFGGVGPMIADGFTNGNKFGSGLLGIAFNERKPWEREVEQMAAGGPVGIAQQLPVPAMAQPAPLGVARNAMVPPGGPMPQMAGPPAGGPPQGPQIGPQEEQLVMATAAVIAGKIPNGEPIIQAFLQKFGPEALQELIASVKQASQQQVPENMGRLLSGPGGGVEDAIPASIDGKQPAALSSGEFVVPAHAVAGLGDGSTEHGARKLQGMVNKVNQSKYGRPTAPPPVDDEEVLPI